MIEDEPEREEMVPARNSRANVKGFCSKCKVSAPAIHLPNSELCIPCFKINVTKHFKCALKASFGVANTKDRKRRCLVVGVDGEESMESHVLVHLVTEFHHPHVVGTEENLGNNEEVVVGIVVSHLDASSGEYDTNLFADIVYIVLTVTTIPADPTIENGGFSRVQSGSGTFADPFRQTIYITAINQLYTSTRQYQIREFISAYAAANSISAVLLPTTQTTFAITSLAMIARGWGAHLVDMQTNTGDDGVVFCEPLLRLSMIEIAGHYENIEDGFKFIPGLVPVNLNGKICKETVESVTRRFVLGLVSEFPSTVSTVAKTVLKLSKMDS